MLEVSETRLGVFVLFADCFWMEKDKKVRMAVRVKKEQPGGGAVVEWHKRPVMVAVVRCGDVDE